MNTKPITKILTQDEKEYVVDGIKYIVSSQYDNDSKATINERFEAFFKRELTDLSSTRYNGIGYVYSTAGKEDK